MTESTGSPPQRWFSQVVARKGLRPRFAAYLIIAFWAVAIIVFGVVEHLVDPDTYPNVWIAMWWALQTVTTVGYGDVVPGQTDGKVIASFLMIGGLSLITVVTAVITSGFVARAQADAQQDERDQITRDFTEIKAELKQIRRALDDGNN